MHGYESVPTYPASHGCTRIPMHIAEYFHTLVHVGDPVYVFGGNPAKIISSTPIAPPVTTAPTVPPPTPPLPPPTAPPATVPRHRAHDHADDRPHPADDLTPRAFSAR